MGQRSPWVGVGVVLLAAAAGGCATRPYASDPLLHNGRGAWGDQHQARLATTARPDEPTSPAPPVAGPLYVGAEAPAVTSP